MPRTSRLPRRLGSLIASTGIIASAVAGGATIASATVAAASPAAGQSTCALGPKGAVKHVIYIQFDNTHLMRDRSNVPSDLEQMPNLLNFMKDNGTVLSNDHTILISHTAGGILSSLTGVYPDRHGQIVSNSNVRVGSSSTSPFSFPSSFGYWTDSVAAAGTPTVPLMVNASGTTAPAPWPTYTRAGCDFGAVATANTVLENANTTATGDITKVFGSGSAEWNQVIADRASSNPVVRARPQADFVGFAIHCAQDSPTCATNSRPDLLPDEQPVYSGFKGLFGAQDINPFLTGQPFSTKFKDILGHDIADPLGNPGFPGFDGMFAATSLSYVAAMQEKGVPVTYAYISDAHDFHGAAGEVHTAFGPGSAGYVAQLKSYDDAFGAFFDRLAADGINKSNTLFVFTVDEGDHFVGSEPANPGCDGVTVACDWDTLQNGHARVGEINANIDTLVSQQFPTLAAQVLPGNTAPFPFTVHGDDAPTFYIAQRGVGQIGQTTDLNRDFERRIATLTAVNPYTSATDHLMVAMADRAEMKLLHMYTAGDANRNPNFAYFANPDYFLTDFPPSTCLTCINPAFAWNHGDIQPEIDNTWLGFVGPGVRNLGEFGDVWTDHTDVRPTMFAELALHDSYALDGRPILEVLDGNAVPNGLNVHRGQLQALGAAYKQLTAPFGSVGMDSLAYITTRIQTGTSLDDHVYTDADAQLADWLSRRDAIATSIRNLYTGLEAGGPAASSATISGLTKQAKALIAEVHEALP